MAISDILKSRRKALGYTLLDVAKKMNVSEATVQRWESGNIKNLRQERIAKLAEVLEISPAELMGWENFTHKTDGPQDILDDVDIGFYGEYKELSEGNKAVLRDMVKIMRERQKK